MSVDDRDAEPIRRQVGLPSRQGLPRCPVVVALVLAVGFLVAPRLVGWQLLHVHKEDGYIFLADGLHLGWNAVFERYTGYLHVLPRLLAAIALQFPPAAYPVVVGLLVALVRVWMACLTYWVLRSRGIPARMSAAMASLFVIVPVGSHEVLGNLTNLRWFGDAMLVVLFVGRLSGARAFAGALTAALCALSDPLAITLAPFALVALWRGRGPARAVPASS